MLSRPALVLLASSLVVTAGCSTSRPTSSGPRSATVEFTCCARSGPDRVYRPGEVIALHWRAKILEPPATAAPATPVPVTLTASLEGGSAGTSYRRSGPWGSVTSIQAKPVHVTDRTTTAPVSRIRLPTYTTPGLYNLTTTVREGGTAVSGTDIVRVR